MTLCEKAAYLKGLAEGLQPDQTTAEGKLIAALIDTVDELAHAVEELEETTDMLNDYAEELDEDLGALEEIVLDECDCDDDCCCDDDEDYYDDEDEDEEEVIFEVDCPECDETICLPATIDLEHVECPACGATFSCVCDEDECECDDCADCAANTDDE